MKFGQYCGLALNILVEQGYDRAAVMSGAVSGVQKVTRDKTIYALWQGWPNCGSRAACGSSNLCMLLFDLFEKLYLCSLFFISITKRRNIVKCYCRTVLLLQVVPKRIMMSQKQWRAERVNGATAPGIQARGHPKSEIIKIKMLCN